MAGDGTVLQDALFAAFSSIPQPNRPIRQTLFASMFPFFQFWGYFGRCCGQAERPSGRGTARALPCFASTVLTDKWQCCPRPHMHEH